MKALKISLVLAFLGMVLVSCNKTVKISNRLADATWRATELTVNGTSEVIMPILDFEECDVFDELCEGKWMDADGEHVEFYWQVRSSKDEFEISYKAEEEEEGEEHEHGHDGGTEALALQCAALSGVYQIEEQDKSSMLLTTTAAKGHPGETVRLKLEKQ